MVEKARPRTVVLPRAEREDMIQSEALIAAAESNPLELKSGQKIDPDRLAKRVRKNSKLEAKVAREKSRIKRDMSMDELIVTRTYRPRVG